MFELFAKARQVAHLPLARRGFQLLQRFDLEILEKGLHPFRAEVRKAEKIGDARRKLPAKFLQGLHPSGLDRLDNFRREVRTDAGNVRQVLVAGQHVAQFAAQALNRPRRVSIGADAERIGPLNVEQIGDLIEHRRDFGIVNQHDSPSPERSIR